MSSLPSSRTSRSESDDQERPERSRNAKAQARHRAKRKAYIEQLETTVTKLQVTFGCTPEELTMMPPPLQRIRELEADNMRLQRENEECRRMLAATEAGRPQAYTGTDYGRRAAPTAYDARDDRDWKKRRGTDDGIYLSPAPSFPGGHDGPSRPPPLTIPQTGQPSSQYGSSHLSSAGHSNGPYNVNGSIFDVPGTPSNASTASSPPFSPIGLAHNHSSSQSHAMSPVGQRQPPFANHGAHQSQYMTQANQYGHYGNVKVEDDIYASPVSSSSHYAQPAPSQYGQQGSYSHHPSNAASYGHEHASTSSNWHYGADPSHRYR